MFGSSRHPDRDLEYFVLPGAEQFVGAIDLVERESMGQQRRKIDSMRLDEPHEPPHPLLASRAKGGDDLVITNPPPKASRGTWICPEYTPTLERVPPGRNTRRAFSNVPCVPRASI